mgnify:CR=1 FL=1
MSKLSIDYCGVTFPNPFVLSSAPPTTTGEMMMRAFEALDAHALALLDDSIARNRRDDGLYHAYNLLRIDEDGHGVDHLHEMLEGQVAVLASGVLTAEASADLLDRLRESRLYRPDQNGYILYPDLPLPGFLQKNLVPA